jgi:hypothetical protein
MKSKYYFVKLILCKPLFLDINQQYSNVCDHYAKLVHHEAIKIMDAFTIVSNEITVLAIADDAVWPYYTVPYFDRLSYLDQRLTRTEIQGIIPMVRFNEREKWLKYSVSNQNWTTTPDNGYDNIGSSAYNSDHHSHSSSFSSSAQEEHANDSEEFYGETTTSTTSIAPYLRRLANYSRGSLIAQTDENELYLPIWQHTPVDVHWVNFDIYSEPAHRNGFDTLRKTLDNVFTEVFFPFDCEDVTRRKDDPYVVIMSPVFSRFFTQDDTSLISDDIVGVVSSTIPWKVIFSDLYTTDALNGLILILTDPAGVKSTFRVDGPKVSLMKT